MNERLIEDGYIPSAFEQPKIEPKKRSLTHETILIFSGLLHRDREIVREARKHSVKK